LRTSDRWGWAEGLEVEDNIRRDNEASEKAPTRAGGKFDSDAADNYEI